MHARILALIALIIALSSPLVGAEPRPETAADPACAGARAGDGCIRGQGQGTCQPGQCCHSNYQNLQPNGAPTQVCQPCLTCQVPLAPLQPLVLPPDDPTPPMPQAVTALEPARAASPAVAEALPAKTTTGPADDSAHDRLSIGVIAALVSAVVAAGAFFFLRNRSAGDK